MKTYKGIITELPDNGIFVFGSNTQGRHGKGAALIAKIKFGAIYGYARGFQGKSFAICTKDLTKKLHPSVPKEHIMSQIEELYYNANIINGNDFYVAYGVNSNLNGYTPQEMANMFSSFPIPNNIVFNENFAKLIKV